MEEEVRRSIGEQLPDWKAKLWRKKRTQELYWVVIIAGVVIACVVGWSVFTSRKDPGNMYRPFPEGTQSFVFSEFRDLILSDVFKLENHLYHPSFRFWRFTYRPHKHNAESMNDLIEQTQSKGWLVMGNRKTETFLEKPVDSRSKQLAILRWSAADRTIEVWTTFARPNQTAQERSRQIDVVVGATSRPQRT